MDKNNLFLCGIMHKKMLLLEPLKKCFCICKAQSCTVGPRAPFTRAGRLQLHVRASSLRCISDAEKYPRGPGDNSTNIVSCVCEVSRRANRMTDGGPIDCSQSSGLPAKIGPLAKSSPVQLICHQAGQGRLHKLHRPTKLTCCVRKPVLPRPTVH